VSSVPININTMEIGWPLTAITKDDKKYIPENHIYTIKPKEDRLITETESSKSHT